jgi:hypothetical protein
MVQELTIFDILRFNSYLCYLLPFTTTYYSAL